MNNKIISRTASTSCRILISALATMLLAIYSAGEVWAQGSTDGTTPLGLSAGSPIGSYALSDFDVVNLYNGI